MKNTISTVIQTRCKHIVNRNSKSTCCKLNLLKDGGSIIKNIYCQEPSNYRKFTVLKEPAKSTKVITAGSNTLVLYCLCRSRSTIKAAMTRWTRSHRRYKTHSFALQKTATNRLGLLDVSRSIFRGTCAILQYLGSPSSSRDTSRPVVFFAC